MFGEGCARILSRAAWTNTSAMCVTEHGFPTLTVLAHWVPRWCHSVICAWVFLHFYTTLFPFYSIPLFFPPRKFSLRNFYPPSGKFNKTLDLKSPFSCSYSAVFSWLSDFIIIASSAPFISSFLSSNPQGQGYGAISSHTNQHFLWLHNAECHVTSLEYSS